MFTLINDACVRPTTFRDSAIKSDSLHRILISSICMESSVDRKSGDVFVTRVIFALLRFYVLSIFFFPEEKGEFLI